MSAALTAHPDLSISPNSSSNIINNTNDFSLTSLVSGFSTPLRPTAAGVRVPSTSSRTTAQSSAPVLTPSPPLGTSSSGNATAFSYGARRATVGEYESLHDEDPEGDLLDTPGGASGKPSKTKRGRSGTLTATATNTTGVSAASKGGGGSKLTLRDQEKHIDTLKKENFSIKLRVHFLEDQLARLTPDQMDAALKQNVSLKVEVQQRGMEIKKLKKLVLELERELGRGGEGGKRHPPNNSSERERELEEKLEERDRELRELRRRLQNRSDDHHDEDQDDEAELLLRESEARNARLEEELDNARGLLEENMDELDRLRQVVEDQQHRAASRASRASSAHDNDNSAVSSSSVDASSAHATQRDQKRRIRHLESENQHLSRENDERIGMLEEMQLEKEDLEDEVRALREDVGDLRERLADAVDAAAGRAGSSSRPQSRFDRDNGTGNFGSEDIDALRDRLASLLISLQTKDEELERKEREVEELVEEHRRIVDVVEGEWRGEVEEARGMVEELRDVLAERDSESKDLRLHISELESDTNALHAKFEEALTTLHTDIEAKSDTISTLTSDLGAKQQELATLEGQLQGLEGELDEKERVLVRLEEELEGREGEMEEKEVEVERLQATIERLGEQIYCLEDEGDRMKEEYERVKEEWERERDGEGMERERLEGVVAGLKEKLASLKSQLQQTTDSLTSEVHSHRARQEELATHVEALVNQLQSSEQSLAQAESSLASLTALHTQTESELRNTKRTLEAKDSALQSALSDLARRSELLTAREDDLKQVNTALQTLEKESRRLGETQTTTRFSLQLEVDRLKRDLERLESELASARGKLASKDSMSSEHQGALDKLHSETRELRAQLAGQTQARLNIGEKLDMVQGVLKEKEAEVGVLRTRVGELEERLGKEQRGMLGMEREYRDQLTERNTLLLTIYQYLDRVLGVDKMAKKGTQGETKPFTNFSVFHDNLITRLKALSQIQLEFDKKCKEIEGRFVDKLTEMRKQLDGRWKQIDKFEANVKLFADAKTQWRRKLSTKEGELEAIKATNAEMATQLSGIKRPNGSDGMEARSLATRAVNAERRLNNAQNQLLASEEKAATLNQRNLVAEGKWEARVKEYEARLKAAEERVKRERQGSKERVAELENTLKSLQRQLEIAQKRNNQLHEVVDQVPSSSSPNR